MVQVSVILFFLVLPIVNGLGIRWIRGSLYALTVGPIPVVDPLMAAQSSVLARSLPGTLLLACVIPVALALIFGKVFCSWVCPYNTVQEGLDVLLKRVYRRRKVRLRRTAGNPPPGGYWAIFGGLLFVMVISGWPVLSFLSMPGLLSTQILQSVGGNGPGWELALVGVLLTGEAALGRRTWCRTLCPVGACLGLFRAPATLRIRYNECTCGCAGHRFPCETACPLYLSPRDPHLYPACIQCGNCLEACAATGYGGLTFGWRTQGPASNPAVRGQQSDIESAPGTGSIPEADGNELQFTNLRAGKDTKR